jgi:hypothetical protein
MIYESNGRQMNALNEIRQLGQEVGVGLYPIVVLEKQRLNLFGHLV